MKQSNFSIDQWLSALFEGDYPLEKREWGSRPNGERERSHIVRVQPGDVVEFGSETQTFGSGYAYTNYVFAGAEPEGVEPATPADDYEQSSFVSTSPLAYRMHAPSVLYVVSGDGIGGGRVFGRTAYVCATDAQIEAAKTVAPFQPTGWSLRQWDSDGYVSWEAAPVYWEDGGDRGLRLMEKSTNFGPKIRELVFCPGGSGRPVVIATWAIGSECYCDARDDESLDCVCWDDELPVGVEEALALMQERHLAERAARAFRNGGDSLFRYLKRAARVRGDRQPLFGR